MQIFMSTSAPASNSKDSMALLPTIIALYKHVGPPSLPIDHLILAFTSAPASNNSFTASGFE